MLGAMAATLAAEADLERVLVLGAAAGGACFLRHGLGTASRAVIEELASRVELRDPAEEPVRKGGSTSSPRRIAAGAARAIQSR